MTWRLLLTVLLFACSNASRRPLAANATTADRCRAGAGESCLSLAVAARSSAERPADSLRALSLFEAACDAGEGAGCVEAAWMLAQGDGVERSAGRAKARYERACELR